MTGNTAFAVLLLAGTAASAPSDGGFHRLLDRAAKGEASALRRVAIMRPRADGAKAEAIDQALSSALQTNPTVVLALAAGAGRPNVVALCEDRTIEPSAAMHARFVRRAVRAVAAVPLASLRQARDTCLATLRRTG